MHNYAPALSNSHQHFAIVHNEFQRVYKTLRHQHSNFEICEQWWFLFCNWFANFLLFDLVYSYWKNGTFLTVFSPFNLCLFWSQIYNIVLTKKEGILSSIPWIVKFNSFKFNILLSLRIYYYFLVIAYNLYFMTLLTL